MGSGLSEVASSPHRCKKEKNNTCFYDMELLPVEIIVEILSYVPAQDLIQSCCLVCQMWRQLIDGHGVWKLKCLRERRFVPPLHFETLPKNIFRNIYLKNPYGRNLIKNASGKEKHNRNRQTVNSPFVSMWRAVFQPPDSEDTLDSEQMTELIPHWIVNENGGDGWIVESTPCGANPVPGEGDQSCFATSYRYCIKHQVIDLIKEGVHEEIMDTLKPTIVVSELHASRFDCGSTYELQVTLLSGDKTELDKFSYGPYVEEQWSGREWTQAKHEFKEYPSGVRYILFYHSGCDTQFWAGYYGSKMARASVTFEFS